MRLLKALLRSLGCQELQLRDADTGTLFLADSRDFVGWELLVKSRFEPQSLQLCMNIMRGRGGVFADIGAHHGLFSATVSALAHVKVVSFEPNPASFVRLLANVRANGRRNVILVHAPLGRADGGLLPWRNTGEDAGATAWSRGTKHGELPDYWLASASLDGALSAIDVEVPTLIKMDVEGAELSVLEGFDFEKSHPPFLLIEAQPHWRQKFAFLAARGYQATGKGGAILEGEDCDPFLEGNALFAHESAVH